MWIGDIKILHRHTKVSLTEMHWTLSFIPEYFRTDKYLQKANVVWNNLILNISNDYYKIGWTFYFFFNFERCKIKIIQINLQTDETKFHLPNIKSNTSTRVSKYI